MKRISIVLSLFIVAAMLFACSPKSAATEAAAPAKAGASTKVCLVTDSGGIGDKSFNDLSWAGVEKGIADFGVDGKYIESKTDADYEPNLKACKDEGAKLIVCVGFMMADACKAAATANPDIYYAGIDMNGFDLPNFRGVTAKMEQSCFQAGYLAAGMTKTGAVATYTGVMGPAVQNFMEGFYWGAMEYNKVHGTSIKVLGYDPKTPDQATVTGSWIDADKGRQLGESFMDDGADIILPVCGSVGSATAAVMKERGSGYIFGVDQDWTQTYPDYNAQVLGSVLKKIDVHVYDSIQRVVENKWEGGDFVLQFSNGGTVLAYNPDVKIPDDLKAEVDGLVSKIESGEINPWPTSDAQ